jgi:predicted transposase YbfD/YdcC
MVPFAGLLAALREIPDPRRRQGRRYALPPLLLFSIPAVLAGAPSYRRLRLLIGAHRERLNVTFGARFRRAPAVNTPRALPHALGPAEVEAAFRRHAEHLGGAAVPPGRRVVAPDGKTLRGSFDHPDGRAAAQVLGASAGEAALILAHQEIAGGDEAAAAQALIEESGLSGVLFTADALHCQKTFAIAAATGDALLVRVKDNRPRSHDALAALREAHPAIDCLDTVDRHAHGRAEHRRSEVCAAERLDPDWQPLIARIVRVTRRTLCRDTRTGPWRPRREVAYHACQIPLEARACAAAIRGHRGMENRNHHVRDRTSGEDASRIRRKPGVFARLRSFALNILRGHGVGNVSEALSTDALSLDRLLAYGLPSSQN